MSESTVSLLKWDCSLDAEIFNHFKCLLWLKANWESAKVPFFFELFPLRCSGGRLSRNSCEGGQDPGIWKRCQDRSLVSQKNVVSGQEGEAWFSWEWRLPDDNSNLFLSPPLPPNSHFSFQLFSAQKGVIFWSWKRCPSDNWGFLGASYQCTGVKHPKNCSVGPKCIFDLGVCFQIACPRECEVKLVAFQMRWSQVWAGGRPPWSATSRPTPPPTTRTSTPASLPSFRRRWTSSFFGKDFELQQELPVLSELNRLSLGDPVRSKSECKRQVRALERQNAALRQSKPPIEPSVDLARERETVDLARDRETGGVNKEENSDIMEARWFLSPMIDIHWLFLRAS